MSGLGGLPTWSYWFKIAIALNVAENWTARVFLRLVKQPQDFPIARSNNLETIT